MLLCYKYILTKCFYAWHAIASGKGRSGKRNALKRKQNKKIQQHQQPKRVHRRSLLRAWNSNRLTRWWPLGTAGRHVRCTKFSLWMYRVRLRWGLSKKIDLPSGGKGRIKCFLVKNVKSDKPVRKPPCPAIVSSMLHLKWRCIVNVVGIWDSSNNFWDPHNRVPDFCLILIFDSQYNKALLFFFLLPL